MSDSATYTERVRDTFLARPGEWIDGLELERIGGRYAWRSRVSDARRQYRMTIQNRVLVMYGKDDVIYRVSQYRYLPADTPTEDLDLYTIEQRLKTLPPVGNGRLF